MTRLRERQSSMLLLAKEAVLNSGEWLTSVELSEITGLQTTNSSDLLNKWKLSGKIFSIHHNGADYYPTYALVPESSPLGIIASIISVFSGHKDNWGIAFWFMSANGYLGGATPKSIITTEPDRVLAAARDEIEVVTHG